VFGFSAAVLMCAAVAATKALRAALSLNTREGMITPCAPKRKMTNLPKSSTALTARQDNRTSIKLLLLYKIP
jgi:hypothetical protein